MSIAELSSILGCPQVRAMPEAPATVTHRIGFSGQPRYIESQRLARQMREKGQKDGLTKGQQEVLKVLKSRKSPFCAREMSVRTGYSKCFCNSAMAILYQQGLLTRVKERVALTKQYVYSIRP